MLNMPGTHVKVEGKNEPFTAVFWPSHITLHTNMRIVSNNNNNNKLIKISDTNIEKAMKKNTNIKKFQTQIIYKLVNTEWDQ